MKNIQYLIVLLLFLCASCVNNTSHTSHISNTHTDHTSNVRHDPNFWRKKTECDKTSNSQITLAVYCTALGGSFSNACRDAYKRRCKTTWFPILADAARDGNISRVETLLEKGADVNAQDDENGKTALMSASNSGHTDIARILIEKGADVNAKSNKLGYTALMLASSKDIVRLLIENGAGVDAKDTSMGGMTALMYASFSGRTDIARLLIEKGADVNAKADKYEQSDQLDQTLAKLKKSGDPKITRLVKSLEKTVNGIQRFNRTALMSASNKGHTDIVRLLIEKGANINAKDDRYGRTALMSASYKGHADTIRILLNKGADVNVKDKNGKTALEHASSNGHTDIVSLLKEKGTR